MADNPERILIVSKPDQKGMMEALRHLREKLPELADKILIVDELPNEHVIRFIEKPNTPVELERPKNEFEKRQEWLDGFRARHRRNSIRRIK